MLVTDDSECAVRESAHLEGRGGVCVPALALVPTPSAQQGQAHLAAVVQVGVEAHRPASCCNCSSSMNKRENIHAFQIHTCHQICKKHQAQRCMHVGTHRSWEQCFLACMPFNRSMHVREPVCEKCLGDA